MQSKPVVTFAIGVLVALMAGIGAAPAMARADHGNATAEVPAEAPRLAVGEAATPLSSARAEAFDEARELYGQGRWSAAYGRFAALADGGHAEAAEIALLMFRYGSRLYGQSWSASQPQIDHWIALSLRRAQALMASAHE